MRYPIQYIAIHRDKCSRSFGVSPCGASGEKCFNTISTCKFLQAYSRTTQVDYFVNPDNTDASIYAQLGDSVYPFLSDIRHKPATINPASAHTGSTALGTRATLDISLRDGGSDDRYQDPYYFERTNPDELGTFFGKYFARNKYLWGRKIEWVNAYVESGQIVDRQVRTYVITQVAGPDARGGVSITAQDVLVLTNAKNAKFPIESSVKLFSDITEEGRTLTVQPSEGLETELGFIDDWPQNGIIRIDNELMRYSKASGLTLNVIRRGDSYAGGVFDGFGSHIDEHTEGSTVQLVSAIENKKPWEIIYQILTQATSIPVELLDVNQWQAESTGKPWMIQQYTAYLSEPMGVNELLADIAQQMMFFPYFDEETNRIRIKATTSNLSYITTVADLDDNENFIESSFKMKRDDDAVVTRVYSHTGIHNWAEDLKDRKNYKAVIALITGEEGDDRRRAAASADIFGYWMNPEQADLVGRMVLRQFAEASTEFQFKLDAKDSKIKLAEFVDVKHRLLIDAYGRPASKPAQIVRAAESIAGTTWDYKAINYPYYPMSDRENIYNILIPTDDQDVNLRALFDERRPSATLESGTTVTFIVGQGVTIGGTTTTAVALQTGSWPQGVELILDCTAGSIFIDGAGGAGGAGGSGVENATSGNGKNGQNGGHALSLSHSMRIVGSPIIRGGGGGGGGGGGIYWALTSGHYSAGGGGGGGGQAAYSASGGAKGVADDTYVSKDGAAGSNGSRSGAGSGGSGGFHWNEPSNFIIGGGDGGNGGSWGQAGQKGSDAFLTYEANIWPVYEHTGGLGGAAGKAVAAGNNLLTAPDAIFYGARSN